MRITGTLDDFAAMEDMGELPAGENVFLDEIADAAAEAVRFERVVRDAVVQHEPARLQDAANF